MNDFAPYSLPAHRDHARRWRDCLYVYPVISRRSRGLSIGINLSRNGACTFNCVYCQVHRLELARRGPRKVDLTRLRRELVQAIEAHRSGALWQEPRFAATPPRLRRLNDIAFSGDGEPTSSPCFAEAARLAAEVRARLAPEAKIIVITNATRLGSAQVRRALGWLDPAVSDWWLKLDAGTARRFAQINRPRRASLDDVLEGIAGLGRCRPVVIQTLWLRWRGRAPSAAETDAYARRLSRLIERGAQIRAVHMHTIARPPAEAHAQPLTAGELEAIAARVRDLADVKVEVF
jgi:wyosine [tRNA(Phe)-imidazoG37] synthetase (radical SAM superfamily)